MTDYRFVSAPEVVLEQNDYGWKGTSVPVMFRGEIDFLLAKGIIEPVPVEIPEHVVEAAKGAFFDHPWAYDPLGAVRAALVAAKQAEEAEE